MPVIREFRCGDCGTLFESMLTIDEVACPKCTATEPERVFLTPPAVKSPKTANTDAIQKDLAQTYGLSDMSNRDGASVMRGQRGPQQAHAQWGTGEQWMAAAARVPPGMTENMRFPHPTPQYVGKVK